MGFKVGGVSVTPQAVGVAAVNPAAAIAGGIAGKGDVMGGLKSIGGKIFGTGDDPGILGTGMFKPQGYDIDESAFKNADPYNQIRSDFARQLEAVNNRGYDAVNPATIAEMERINAAQIARGDSDQVRGRQMTLADQLTAQAAGQGPSLATMQLKQATDRNIAQAMALAASQRGGAAGGLGLRNVQQQQTQLQGQAARDSAMARMQEQLSAREQLAGVLQGTRGLDINLASNQAQLEQATRQSNQQAANQRLLQQAQLAQQASIANQQAMLQNRANNDAMARFYTEGGLNATLKQQESLMGLEKLKADQKAALEQARAQSYGSAAQARGGIVGGLGAGLAAAFSDKELKTDIEDEDDEEKGGFLKDFLKGFSMDKSSKAESGGSGHQQAGKAMGSGIAQLAGLGKYAAAGEGAAAGGAAASAAPAAAAAASDEKLKTNVSESPEKLDEFISHLKAYKYKYKDPAHGDGTYVSPMAQDLEKSEIGRSMVIDTPEGKLVDYSRAAGTMLATAAMLNDRVSELEAAIKRKKAARAS